MLQQSTPAPTRTVRPLLALPTVSDAKASSAGKLRVSSGISSLVLNSASTWRPTGETEVWNQRLIASRAAVPSVVPEGQTRRNAGCDNCLSRVLPQLPQLRRPIAPKALDGPILARR